MITTINGKEYNGATARQIWKTMLRALLFLSSLTTNFSNKKRIKKLKKLG